MAAGCKPVRVEVAVHPLDPGSPQDLHLRGLPTAELKELACRYADKVPPPLAWAQHLGAPASTQE